MTPDGRIQARLDDSRQIEFNAAEHRHFDHGYAVSSHSSQGGGSKLNWTKLDQALKEGWL